jgi:preprotein translocase subunit SecE
MAKWKALQFIDEVKRETKRISWPSMAETRMSTIMVFVMVAISAVFLFTADQVINSIIKLILGIKE